MVTMARQMAFQRKGAPVDDTGPATPDDSGGDPQDSQDDGDTCPNCGCVFDPESGDVVKPGKPVQGGPESKDYGGQKGGQDLQLPNVPADAQAPAGDAAITQALAAVLAQHGG